MPSSDSSTSRRKTWIVLLSLLGGAVVIVLSCLAYLVLTLPPPGSGTLTTEQSPVLSLPTAAPATATPGPPVPVEAIFAAEEPIEGFSDCEKYGFTGTVTTSNGGGLEGVEVVAWEEEIGLIALDTTDAEGVYLIEIPGKPDHLRLWVQLYQDDVAVSDPLPVTAHVDCYSGFQIYQINWRALPE